jgi:type I restriction enzyme S subunit
VSELPKGWAEARLTDIVDLHDSRRIPLNKEQRQQRQGSYPYYGANGLVDHIDDYLFEGDFVLLAEDGGYFDDPARGVAYEASGKFWVNNHAHILSPRAEIPNSFLMHLLNSISWLPHVGGSTRFKLTQAGMQQVPVTVPPLLEQRRIVAKLDSLRARSSRARQELDHIPKLIERFKQAILAKAFSGKLTADWRADNSVENGETVPLDSVADDFSYGSSAKSSPSGRVPVLRMGNIQNGKLDWSDLVYTSDEAEIKKYQLRSGDVLFNRTNSPELVGKTALFSGEREAIYAGYLIRVRCGDRLLPSYLTYCLNSPLGRNYCWQVKTDGVSQSNVNAKKLAAFEFLLPTVDEQTEIVRQIDRAFAWLDKIATEHARAEHLLPKLDQAILAKAFRGELVPQDPNDEPASKLLERIAKEASTGRTPKKRSTT